jgi:hypothetical protein
VTQFSHSFVKNDYKQARENVLYELEKAMFFDTQPHVEAEKKRQDVINMINKKQAEKNVISRDMRAITVTTVNEKVRWGEMAKVLACIDIDILVLDFESRHPSDVSVDTVERRKFIKHCPYPSCNGYLSTAWKCGLCEKYTCNLCHEPKLDGHVCNEDTVKSVALIKVDSKPCPKCGVSIHKTEGCFGIDTPIILWSGETKMSQDILVGDILIGDDGKPRTVLELFNGTDELYEVSQNNGTNYTVNSKHKLVLIDENIIEITVDDYLNLHETCKNRLFGFKVCGQKSVITVKSVGRGSYYGWVLDGNMRFLLSDCTVLRNCDQMYCTHCHIAFSWRTGRIEIGRIHNPHYYQYMRENGQAERELGDIQCGGLPNIRALNSKLQELSLKSKDKTDLYAFHMLMTEFQELEIPNIPETTAFDLNREMRIKHMMGQLPVSAFKGYIQQQDKSINKKRELLMVGSTFVQIVSDIMNRLMELKTCKNIEQFNTELSNACNYINKLYLDIAIAYDCIVPIFKFPGGYRKMKRTEIKL